MTKIVTKLVPTNELKVGDIVRFYNSRLLITKHVVTGEMALANAKKSTNYDYYSYNDRAAYDALTLTLNAFDSENLGPVNADYPQSFTTGWRIQGNKYATWIVEA